MPEATIQPSMAVGAQIFADSASDNTIVSGTILPRGPAGYHGKSSFCAYERRPLFVHC